ncbi:hypothetical protein Ancab_002180 [Ancistrocladus abbreviatus]
MDVVEIERKLNQVWIGTFKLRAKFSEGEGEKRGEAKQEKAVQRNAATVNNPGTTYAADIVKRPLIHGRQEQERALRGNQMKGNCLKVRSDQTDLSWLQGSFTDVLKSSCPAVNIQEELWKAGLLDYSVRSLGGKLVLIKPLGDANLINLKTENKGKLAKCGVFSKSAEQWGDLVAMDVDTIDRNRLDVARFSIFTNTLGFITTTLRLMVNEDECSIFVAEEGPTPIERVRAGYPDRKESSVESSRASLHRYASVSVVPESVEEICIAGKMATANASREPNTEDHNYFLRINALANEVQGEPASYDGLESRKF